MTHPRPELAIAERVAGRPGLAVVAWCCALLVAAVGLSMLKVETSTESVLDTAGSEWHRYLESVRTFGSDEVVVVAFPTLRDPTVAVEESVRLSAFAEGLRGVRRVDSLATLPLLRVDAEGSIDLRPATELARDWDSGALGALEIARLDPVARGLIVSDFGSVVAVNVIFEEGVPAEHARIVKSLREQAPNAWISGVPVFREETTARTRTELSVFVPVTATLVGIVLALYCGLLTALSVLVTASIGSVLSLGLMGFAAVPLTISTMILPSILFVLGTAYSLHVVHAWDGSDEASTVGQAADRVVWPVLLSGLTTAVGFAALGLVEIPVVRQLGVFGAVGTSVQVLAVLFLLPSAMTIVRSKARTRGQRVFASLSKVIAHVSTRRPLYVALVWIGVLTPLSLGIQNLDVETDAVEWFSPGSEVRTSYDQIRIALSGISPMNVVLDSEGAASVADPVVLDRVERLESYLGNLPEVGKAVSFATPVLRLNSQFLRGGEELSAPLIEQYMLLLDSVSYMRDLVTPDYTATNIVLRVDNNGSRSLLEVASRAVEWWRINGDSRFEARATGIMYEFARSEEEIAWGQVRGLSAAVAGISIVLLLVLRRPLLAAAALLPNLVPLVVAFGVLGTLGIALDAVTIGIGCLVLGIAVDDTIHIVIWHQRGVAQGLGRVDAVRFALDNVLRPVALATLAIFIGFVALTLSGFAVTRNLGGVTALMMVVCLLADLTIVPAVLASSGGKDPTT